MESITYKAERRNRKFSKSPKVKALMAKELFDRIAPEIKGDFDDVVEGWKSDVFFDIDETVTLDALIAEIHPDGNDVEIYEFVTRGTKPHPIPKHGPSYLAFQLGYVPRTTPGKTYQTGDGRAYGPWIRGTMQVNHPGTIARDFEGEIANDRYDWTIEEIDEAWERSWKAV